ncbi:MAG: ABC transporter ATP-binding protein [Deltaproteobacteria bacterium]
MISFQNVTKRYGATVAVEEISFNVARGEFFALLGPNGAGKTTLIKMLLGFVRPDSGRVDINGIPAGEPRTRASIGYLEEMQRIPPQLSGRRYLERSAALLGIRAGEAAREVDRVLELCAMTGDAKGKSAGYSKGMRQRIGLAAAMLGKPELLVLDEPTSGLDPFFIREIRLVLDSMHQSGTTLIINSHILSEVEKICDNVAFLQRGRLVLKDRLKDVMQEGDQSLEDVFIRQLSRRENE